MNTTIARKAPQTDVNQPGSANQNEPRHVHADAVAAPTIQEFFETLFGPDDVKSGHIHVTRFGPEPGLTGAKWFGRRFMPGMAFSPDDNNYFVIGSLKADDRGRALGALQSHHMIVADDVGTKVDPMVLAARMGATPTFRIETSPGNETWGWLLDKPVLATDLEQSQIVAAIRDHMKHNGLTDPGAADPVRYIRLFVGRNSKEAYQNPLDGSFPSCRLVEWNPSARVVLGDLAEKLLGENYLDDVRSGKFLSMAQVRDGSASASMSDPWVKLAGEIGLRPRRGSGPGKIDADCPNMSAHSQRPDSGFALLGGGVMKCQHGECAHLTVKDMQGLMYECYERQVADRAARGLLVADAKGHLVDVFTGAAVPATGAGFVAVEVFAATPFDAAELAVIVADSSKTALDRTGLPQGYKPTSFQLRASTVTPPRQWLYANLLIRGHVSLLVAPGGAGKSTLVLVEELAMATGRPLLGGKPIRALRVMSLNLEDPHDELDRRAVGAANHHKLTDADIGGRFFQISGRDVPFKIVKVGQSGSAVVQRAAVEWLIDLLQRERIDVLFVDPFVGCHDASENDNVAINAVVSAWREIADRAQCAVLLVHHVGKAAALGGDAQGVYGSRGAGALIDGVRSARFLVTMTKDEAPKFGVRE